jgi:hypothetical protein
MTIDFEKMIACKNEEGGKQFNIKRKKGNKVEFNLMDIQYDRREWTSMNFFDQDIYFPSSSIIWYNN